MMRAHLKPYVDKIGNHEKDGGYTGDRDDFRIEDVGGDGTAVVESRVEGSRDSQTKSAINSISNISRD